MFKSNVIPLDVYDKLRPNGDSLCRAILRNGIATAFFVRLPSEPPFDGMCGLMSNNHVYGFSSIVSSSMILLEYKGLKSQEIKFTIGCDRYTFTSKRTDATFIEIKTTDVPGEYGFVTAQISQTPLFVGNILYVVQLFGGGKPSISQGKLKSKTWRDLVYTSPTTFGSSGSMVLNRDGCVVGIAHSVDEKEGLGAGSTILSILEEMKPTFEKKYYIGRTLVWHGGNYDYITHSFGVEMTDGVYCMAVEVEGLSIGCGLAVKSLLPSLTTSDLRDQPSGTCCFSYAGIYCGNEVQIIDRFFSFQRKTTVELMFDASNHMLCFFVSAMFQPYCIVNIPPSVFFLVTGSYEGHTAHVESVKRLAKSMISSAPCFISKFSWK